MVTTITSMMLMVDMALSIGHAWEVLRNDSLYPLEIGWIEVVSIYA
jgi:hypothetical protein